MKNLSKEKLQQVFLSDFPTYYQRYWLQLVLELLDPDTDYHHDCPVSEHVGQKGRIAKVWFSRPVFGIIP